MSEQTTLERGYRRILAWYPRSFRRDNEDEILAVLLDTATEVRVKGVITDVPDSAKVPTAPLICATAISSRAASSRARPRSNSA